MASYRSYHPVDPILTGLVVEMIQDESAFIAAQALEEITLPSRSATLLIENDRNFQGDVTAQTLRAPGASRAEIASFDRTNLVIEAEDHGLSHAIPLREIKDSQFPMDEEARVARMVARALLIAKERRAAGLLFDTVTFNNTVPGTKWDAATGKPLQDMRDEADRQFKASGAYPDTMVIGYDAFSAICENPEVRGYIGDAGQGIASGERILQDSAAIDVLRRLIRVENIFVASARYESARPGLASSTNFIWDGETVFMGSLRLRDGVSTGTNTVKMGPLAAGNFVYEPWHSGSWESLDRINKHVWVEEGVKEKVIDADFGGVLSDCLT